MAVPATPSTPAEHERYERVLQSAEVLLAQEGEQGLHMKLLASRSGVALATLYRYFPSKDHVLGAIALERHRRALQRLDPSRYPGATAGERVGGMLVREFQSVQREPGTAAALQRVANTPDRSTSEYVEGITEALGQMALAVAGADGDDVSEEQALLLPLVLAASQGAITNWLCGTLSADQAREQTRLAARLLDLPPDVIRAHLLPHA